MPRYAALLRAINVGGTGKLPMADLRALATAVGFAGVKTHLASGNLVFDTDLGTQDACATLVTALTPHLSQPPGVILRDGATLAAVLHDLPFPQAAPAQLGVLFCPTPMTEADIASPAGQTTEALALHHDHIVIHYPDGMGRSRLRLPAMTTGTMRNKNTVAKLAQMTA